jgi:protein ImuB
MAWPRFEPAPRLEESAGLRDLETLEACASLETLAFSLKTLSDKVCARLRGRAERACRLRLSLVQEGPSLRAPEKIRPLEVPLALPQGSPSGLTLILLQALETELRLRPLDAALTALKLEVLETCPGPGSQRDFFDQREREQESWNSLVNRLSQKLGQDQVFLAELVQCYLPERAWQKTLQEPARKDQPPACARPLGPRPSRLLPRPLPLQRNGDELLQFEKRRFWHARAWHGPERLKGSWWKQGFKRDYYQVETREGPRLWVYTLAGPDATLWLHGYFD